MTKIIKRQDGYWITELPMSTPDCGPYRKLEGDCVDNCAKAAMKALEKFFLFDYWDMIKGKGKGKGSSHPVKVRVKKLT